MSIKRKTIFCNDCLEGIGTTASIGWKKRRRKFVKNHWGHKKVEGLPLLTAQEIVEKAERSNQ